MIKIVCLSDTHSKNLLTRWKIPGGDILIHAGDLTARGSEESIKKVGRELLGLPHRYKVVIAGNHDRCFWEGSGYNGKAVELLPGIIVLQDETIELLGLRIYGTSWIKFKEGKYPFEIESMPEKWALIPTNTDILVTHMPPHGILDLNSKGGRMGSKTLTNEVKNRIRPGLHVFGHIHPAYGKVDDGETIFVNAALTDDERKPANVPIVVEL